MEYSTADTIAYRLSKLSPWRRDNSEAVTARPWFTCMFCEASRQFGDTGTHDPECLWLNARQYIGLLNAPVTSQEPADSPIESRVSELLGETETLTQAGWETLAQYGKGASQSWTR